MMGVISFIAGNRWLAWIAVAGILFVMILFFLMQWRKAGEAAGRAAEKIKQMEATNAARQKLRDARPRARSRGELRKRLRDGSF